MSVDNTVHVEVNEDNGVCSTSHQWATWGVEWHAVHSGAVDGSARALCGFDWPRDRMASSVAPITWNTTNATVNNPRTTGATCHRCKTLLGSQFGQAPEVAAVLSEASEPDVPAGFGERYAWVELSPLPPGQPQVFHIVEASDLAAVSDETGGLKALCGGSLMGSVRELDNPEASKRCLPCSLSAAAIVEPAKTAEPPTRWLRVAGLPGIWHALLRDHEDGRVDPHEFHCGAELGTPAIGFEEQSAGRGEDRCPECAIAVFEARGGVTTERRLLRWVRRKPGAVCTSCEHFAPEPCGDHRWHLEESRGVSKSIVPCSLGELWGLAERLGSLEATRAPDHADRCEECQAAIGLAASSPWELDPPAKLVRWVRSTHGHGHPWHAYQVRSTHGHGHPWHAYHEGGTACGVVPAALGDVNDGREESDMPAGSRCPECLAALTASGRVAFKRAEPRAAYRLDPPAADPVEPIRPAGFGPVAELEGPSGDPRDTGEDAIDHGHPEDPPTPGCPYCAADDRAANGRHELVVPCASDAANRVVSDLVARGVASYWEELKAALLAEMTGDLAADQAVLRVFHAFDRYRRDHTPTRLPADVAAKLAEFGSL